MGLKFTITTSKPGMRRDGGTETITVYKNATMPDH